MTGKKTDKSIRGGKTREERLKAALKANMGRRKAQARARAEDSPDAGNETQMASETSREEQD